jgi:hypothetical protein
LALCWKLILSCPETQEDEEFFPFLQMLRRKFQKSLGGGTVRGEGDGLLVCRTVPGSARPGTTVSACVRQVGKNYEYVSPLTVEYLTNEDLFDRLETVLFFRLFTGEGDMENMGRRNTEPTGLKARVLPGLPSCPD